MPPTKAQAKQYAPGITKLANTQTGKSNVLPPPFNVMHTFSPEPSNKFRTSLRLFFHIK